MRSQSRAATPILLVIAALAASDATCGPRYENTRAELEAMLEDMIAWWPGVWDSYPQIHLERTTRVPPEGEHDHWHRTFARIDAPQIGEIVFYGQINLGGRDGQLLPGSQILYKVHIDEQRGVISVMGQGPVEPEKFRNLHDHPELWGQVRMRDPASVKCDFVWHRSGTQLVGVLSAPTEERRKYGPGTCTYVSERTGKEFYADAQWVLSPEELWLYDINTMDGRLFIGREDRTHIKLYRARPYTCELRDAGGRRRLDAYDRGFQAAARGQDGREYQLMLLRAYFPAADGRGLDDRLRILLQDAQSGQSVAQADGAPKAEVIGLRAAGVNVSCRLAARFAPLH
jgi:hypothetical protein